MFGAEATRLLTNNEDSIFKSRGHWYDINIDDNLEPVLGISMFHPRYILAHPESKKETWKADMDGEVDCSSKEIKGAIDDMLAEDVF